MRRQPHADPSRRSDRAGLGHDREDDFAGEADRVSGQDRVIPGCGAAVVPAGNVPRFENGHNSREGAHGGEIHGADEAASGPRRAGRQVHRARRLRQIVDVVRRAADVPRRTVVGESPPDAPARCAAGVGDLLRGGPVSRRCRGAR